MKILLFILLVLFNIKIALSQNTVCDTIQDMYDHDQAARMKYVNAETDSSKRIDSIGIYNCDLQNFQIIEKIFKQYGFIDFERFDTLCSNNFWILVQHADKNVKFQEKYLKSFKQNIDKGIKPNYAYLKDRVLVNTNKKQLFGTQGYTYTENDKIYWTPRPIKHEKKVDKRRNKYGLKSLVSYTNLMNNFVSGEWKETGVLDDE
ncbi:MAG: hypothetical protein LRY27_04835 [Chitinophagales bacterium]|nr:hypothetical protein [Chitinophagales bacterium]